MTTAHMHIDPHFFARHCEYEVWQSTDETRELRVDARCLFGDWVMVKFDKFLTPSAGLDMEATDREDRAQIEADLRKSYCR